MRTLRLKRILITRKDGVKQHYWKLYARFKKKKKKKQQLYHYKDLRFYRRIRTDKRKGRRKTGAENAQAEFPDFLTTISPKQLRRKLGRKMSRILHKYKRFRTKDALNIGFGSVRKIKGMPKRKQSFQLTLFDYTKRKIVKKVKGFV